MKKASFFALLGSLFALTAAAQKQNPVFNHMALYVTDLQKSTDFYRKIIQLDTIPEPFRDGKHTWFGIGGYRSLHLIAGEGAIAPQPKNHHFCFSVASLEAFIDNLNKAGIGYEDVKGNQKTVTTRPDGVKQIYLQDPDGYWIEINNEKH
jgi:lactoylglutathione lyase